MTTQPIESGLDVVMVLLYAPGSTEEIGESIKGITRLQKLLFLLWKEGKFFENIPNLYGFQAYDFGPCMDDIYDDLDFAVDIGLIQINEVPSGNEFEDGDEEAFLSDFGFSIVMKGSRRDYELTLRGIKAAKEIFDSLGGDDKERLIKIKKKYNSMPFFNLLRYVYQKYPKFARKAMLSL